MDICQCSSHHCCLSAPVASPSKTPSASHLTSPGSRGQTEAQAASWSEWHFLSAPCDSAGEGCKHWSLDVQWLYPSGGTWQFLLAAGSGYRPWPCSACWGGLNTWCGAAPSVSQFLYSGSLPLPPAPTSSLTTRLMSGSWYRKSCHSTYNVFNTYILSWVGFSWPSSSTTPGLCWVSELLLFQM